MRFCRSGLLVLNSDTISGAGLGSLVMPNAAPDIEKNSRMVNYAETEHFFPMSIQAYCVYWFVIEQRNKCPNRAGAKRNYAGCDLDKLLKQCIINFREKYIDNYSMCYKNLLKTLNLKVRYMLLHK